MKLLIQNQRYECVAFGFSRCIQEMKKVSWHRRAVVILLSCDISSVVPLASEAAYFII